MPGIFEIKARIEGLKSIYNITYAMQIVTISRLKRITSQLMQTKDSLEEVRQILGYLADERPAFHKRLLQQEIDPTLSPVFVLFFSNRGFCGSFNQDILNAFHTYCQKKKINQKSAHVVCVGKKGPILFKTKVEKVHFAYPAKDLFTVEEGLELYKIILDYVKEKRQIFFVNFDFKSIISQKIKVHAFYPPAPSEFEPQDASQKTRMPHFVEPSVSLAEDKMIEHYYYLKLFSAIRDSASSEFSQRFLLMKSAVDNVKELSEELMLELNKERQRMITQEISEIISTFKALQK